MRTTRNSDRISIGCRCGDLGRRTGGTLSFAFEHCELGYDSHALVICAMSK
jgi:hypothetical protein